MSYLFIVLKYVDQIFIDLGLYRTLVLFSLIGYVLGNIVPASFLRYLFTRFMRR